MFFFFFVDSTETKSSTLQIVVLLQNTTGFTLCDYDIHWFVIQIKYDTMSTDIVDIKELSMCLPVFCCQSL